MLDFELDELADNDPLLLQDAPMRPIRLQYVTLTTERALLVDTLERLGLAHAWVGRQLFALNETDSNAIRLTAREFLADDGIADPTDAELTHRVEQLLMQLVFESAGTVERSALRDPSRVAQIAQEMRAQADADLAAHGVDMKARIAHAVAESEAA